MSATAVGKPSRPTMSPVLITIVVAAADNDVIGSDGRLPWRLKSELAHFRKVTLGKPVVMGRKTFLSIGTPLKGRTNIVVSRDPDFAVSGVLVASSVEAALAVARGDALRRGSGEIAVIGGADIYRQTLPLADRIVFTRVHLRPAGETTFPAIDPQIWVETGREDFAAGPHDDASFTVQVFDRVGAAACKG
ncbi:MAG: dihydrofolate reductase [Xanthobacteraceae bacterium]